MLTEIDRRAAEILARMPELERRNAARLGFVSLGIRLRAPSFVAETVDITPEILAEEQRLRSTQSPARRTTRRRIRTI